MKEVKSFIIADFILFIIKLVGGLLCSSYTLLASGIYDIGLIISALFVIKENNNTKYRGIISSWWGFLLILSAIGIVFISEVEKIMIPSFFILLFLVITIIIRYLIPCFKTNISYQKKKGLLMYGVINSTIDFYNYGIILGVLVLAKLSKWIDIFKYADRIGTILIAGLILFKGIRIISNSFKKMEDRFSLDINTEVKNEIVGRNEIKSLDKLEVTAYGGITKASCNILIKDSLQLLDLISFVITLQDYLFKKLKADVVQIILVDKEKKKVKVKVRSLKQDARNSRGRNGKTNAKKKNTKQKNKKR